MKKIFAILTALILLLTLSACGGNTVNSDESTEALIASASTSPYSATSDTTTQSTNKSLVVYFSWSGNTEKMAYAIQSQTNAEIFKLIPETPYSEDYDTVLDEAQREQRTDARPAISDEIENISQYDTIYVGFPNWWGDMPMILYTFFDSYDLSGKTIIPFCTSGGSGFSGTIGTMKALEPNAVITDGLHLGSSAAKNPDSAISEWLTELGLV